jgi:virginiamycin B lyase
VTNGPQVHPHDIWPAGDGTVWYTGQFKGTLGRITVATGAFCEIPLGAGSSPHGVISGPDGDAWVTDQGRNSIIRVDRATQAITEYPVPAPFVISPHTGAWDQTGILWFTGINGFVGRLDPGLPTAQAIQVWPAPLGPGPYGIDATPSGDIWFVTLRSGDGYLGKINKATGAVQQVAIPSPGNGPRRVWSDSQGRLWVTLWHSGHLGRYDPATQEWELWTVPPGSVDSPYAIYVDDDDIVWLTAFAPNALVRFDPVLETFTSFPFPSSGSAVRQIIGDGNGIWGAASGVDGLLYYPTP